MKKTFIFIFLMCFGFVHAQNISYITSGGKLKPLQAIMDIRHYTLNLDVDIEHKSIDGFAEIKLILLQSTDTLLFDLVHVLNVKKILVDNKSQNYVQKDDEIFITGAAAFAASVHTVKIYYGGNPPVAVKPPWEGGFTWGKDKNGNPWISINCQLNGAKIYFPCKDNPGDEPDEGADLFITIPKGLSVAGPGLLQSVKKLKNNKATWHWKTNYTISNYCIVFDIGKYKVVEKQYIIINGNKVPMQFYVLEEDTAYASHALEIKERDTKILEKYFGEYPWIKEKIGLAEVPNSGMEHQTMVTYGDHFNYKKIGGQDYSGNLFHEYAHEWWANKITNKDWAHLWIQEGMATYSEALAMRELGGEAAYDSIMNQFRILVAINGNKKPVVQGDALDMKTVYHHGVYYKGAMLMHTLRYILGDSVFFPTVKRFITDVQYPYEKFFTSDDVEQFFITATGKDLKPIFDFYLHTTKEIEINLARMDTDTYWMFVNNAPADSLPLDIVTSEGIVHTTMKATLYKPFIIKSKTPPVVDPRGWYFRKIIFL